MLDHHAVETIGTRRLRTTYEEARCFQVRRFQVRWFLRYHFPALRQDPRRPCWPCWAFQPCFRHFMHDEVSHRSYPAPFADQTVTLNPVWVRGPDKTPERPTTSLSLYIS